MAGHGLARRHRIAGAQGLQIYNRRRLIEIAGGRPDGMTVDATGAVWIAIARAGRVHRYAPNGTLDLVVEMPVSRVTSCTFGGADLGTPFITTARPRPPQLPEAHAGSLFALRPGVIGLPANAFAA